MIERERKFRFKGDLGDLKRLALKRHEIEQAYLINREKYELRIRKSSTYDNCWDVDSRENKYLLTLKHDTFNKEVRYEIEFPIPKFLGKLLFKGRKLIIKNRFEYKLYHQAKVFVDEYISPPIESIVEIESFTKTEIQKLPLFCGHEITGNSCYKNKNIYKLL